jgi:hypothetical protein
VPALQLGTHQFQHGRLVLTNSADVAAIRRHPWYGSRIFIETPAVRRQLAADQVLRQELDDKQRALRDEAAYKRRQMGPRGSLGPDVGGELAEFPVRRTRRSW